MTKQEKIQKIIERTTSRIQKPNPKDYRYVIMIRWNGTELCHHIAHYNFPWSNTQIIRKLLELNYDHNNISNIGGAPSLEEVIDKNLFDIEKFECGGDKFLGKYSDKSD